MKSLREQAEEYCHREYYCMWDEEKGLLIEGMRMALEAVKAKATTATGVRDAYYVTVSWIDALLKELDVDYTTDTARHPFVGKGALCERCGEARDWHKEEPK